jgi:hypothetical protein
MSEQNARPSVLLYSKGLIGLSAGLLVVIAAFILHNQNESLAPFIKLFEGIGVFIVLTSIVALVKVRMQSRNPEMARQARIETQDERLQLIRSRSGNNAFFVSQALIYLALLFSGQFVTPISQDLVWYTLAVIVIVSWVVYVGSLIVYEKRY